MAEVLVSIVIPIRRDAQAPGHLLASSNPIRGCSSSYRQPGWMRQPGPWADAEAVIWPSQQARERDLQLNAGALAARADGSG